MLPNVVIKLENGGLGRIASTSDGIAGMVLTGKAEGQITLNKELIFTSASDLVKLKITAEQNPLLTDSVNEFYATAGDGATLYVTLVAPTTTLKAMCDGVTSPVGKMITGANGKIRLVAINKLPDKSYSPTITTCIDKDAIDAMATMQVLATNMQGKVMPFRAFVPAYGWSGEVTSIYSPRESAFPNVGMVISASAQGNIAVARVMGRASAERVSVSIARVASGMITNSAKWADGADHTEHSNLVEVLHEAGYILYRTFPTRNGYYINDDIMAAPATNDYSQLNIGRVVDKAYVTAYSAYLDFVNEAVAVDGNGKILTGTARYIESVLQNVITNVMGNEISSVTVSLNSNIDVIATSTIEVALDIVPLGTVKHINVLLQMSNPNND